MKTLLLLPLILALPAYAGTSAKEVIAPPPAPCLTSWFLGGSVGYLTELEEPMYNIHAGVTNSCWKVAGCNVSLFLEVGYTDTDESYSPQVEGPGADHLDNYYNLDDLAHSLQGQANVHDTTMSYDLQIIPITLNFKLDRTLVGNLNAYFGAGMGVANVNLDINHGDSWHSNVSEDDWVFTAQIFAGLSYSFTPAFEVYGGARWIYYQDADVGGHDVQHGGGNTLDLSDDCLLELGARYKF
jgi:opacity protein-like surface antigen